MFIHINYCNNFISFYFAGEWQLPCRLNSLTPGDDMWCQSTMAQIMDSCLRTPSHYLNQCWPEIILALIPVHIYRYPRYTGQNYHLELYFYVSAMGQWVEFYIFIEVSTYNMIINNQGAVWHIRCHTGTASIYRCLTSVGILMLKIRQSHNRLIGIPIPLCLYYTPAQRSWRGGILDSPRPSVRLSVRPSVCPSVRLSVDGMVSGA